MQEKIRQRCGVLSRQMFLVQGGAELADRRVMSLLQALQIDGPQQGGAYMAEGSHPFLREFAQDMAQRGPLPGGSAAWASEFQQQARRCPPLRAAREELRSALLQR